MGIAIVVLITVFFAGCVFPGDKGRLVILEAKIIRYEQQAEDIYQGVKDRTLTIGQAETLFKNIRTDTAIIAGEIRILRDKGKKGD